VSVDSAPVLEKPPAEQAGLGWIGKHTNLIARDAGSWFLLGEIYNDLPLPVDAPATGHCGRGRACLDVCPTQAIVAPNMLDARRCISYLTIEHRDAFTDQQSTMVGDHLFGCDVCQDVCPWNVKFAREPQDGALAPRPELAAPDVVAFATMDDASFRARFRDTPLSRAKAAGLRRNAAAVLGNAATAPSPGDGEHGHAEPDRGSAAR